MKPSVKLIKGLHITASDKRAILDVIAHLKNNTGSDINGMYGRKGSRKQYGVVPDPKNAGRYGVVIRERYRTDYGAPRERTSTVFVEVRGIEQLAPRPGHPESQAPSIETPDMFADAE
ncbi:MAG: hypothetical protein ABGX47_07140 [Martelella sp.]|uniref:hypothetical protein n=1 Tax=Martelella sp. TaxID=1969699 RepID=UPI003241DE9C